MNENEKLELEKHLVFVSKKIGQKIFDTVNTERLKFGTEFATRLQLAVLAGLTSSVVYGFMMHEHATEEDVEVSWQRYKVFKAQVEGAIAAGFEEGFYHFNPKTYPDYSCEITLLSQGPGTDKES